MGLSRPNNIRTCPVPAFSLIMASTFCLLSISIMMMIFFLNQTNQRVISKSEKPKTDVVGRRRRRGRRRRKRRRRRRTNDIEKKVEKSGRRSGGIGVRRRRWLTDCQSLGLCLWTEWHRALLPVVLVFCSPKGTLVCDGFGWQQTLFMHQSSLFSRSSQLLLIPRKCNWREGGTRGQLRKNASLARGFGTRRYQTRSGSFWSRRLCGNTIRFEAGGWSGRRRTKNRDSATTSPAVCSVFICFFWIKMFKNQRIIICSGKEKAVWLKKKASKKETIS